MIAHIVFFQPKTSVSAEQRRAFIDAIRHAVREIPEIQRALIGRTLSFGLMPEQLGHNTYDYAAIFEFSSPGDLKRYLDHPAHANVGRLFWQLGALTLVADVTLEDPENLNIESLLV